MGSRSTGRVVRPAQPLVVVKTASKELEAENARLRRAVSDLTLDKQILAEAARGNSFSIRGAWRNSSFVLPP